MRNALVAVLGAVAVLSPDTTPPLNKKTKKDLELGSAITFSGSDIQLSSLIQAVKETSGNRIKLLTPSMKELEKAQAERFSIAFSKRSFWAVAEHVMQLSSLEFESLNNRSLNLTKAPSRNAEFSSAGKSKIVGAFLLVPEIEKSSKKLCVRVRPEPWIGGAQLLGYKAGVTFSGGKSMDQVGKVTQDAFDSSSWETNLEITTLAATEPTQIAKLELEARLLVPIAWEAKPLGPVGKLSGKEVRVGKTKIKFTVEKAEGDLRVHVAASPLWIPAHGVHLLDAKGEVVWLKAYNESGGNGNQYLSFEYPLDKFQGDPLSYGLEIQAPVETVEHVLKATLEDFQLPR